MLAFVLGWLRAASKGDLEIPQGFQQSQVILPLMYKGEINEIQRCSHSTWFLDGAVTLPDSWVAFP